MVKLRFDTDLATSLQASNDLAKAVDRIGDNLSTAAKEANALERAAKRIVDANLTPLERYNRSLDTMARAVKAGKLSMDDAEKTAARLRSKLDEAGQSGKTAFGAAAVDSLLSYAQGMVGISAAIGGISQAFRQVETDAQSAADRVFGSLGAFGELQQVATSPQDFQRLAGQARGFVSSGVFAPEQMAQAADFVFALRNAGYTDAEMSFIGQLGSSKQVKPENLQKVAEGLKKFQNIFGAKQAGTIEQVAQKVFSAAGTMQTDFAPAATAATLFGSEAAALGYSDEEALAAFVAIEQQSPGAEEAATRLRSMLTQIQKQGLNKGSLSATVTDLVAKVRRGRSAISLLGETRAAAGLNILSGVEGSRTFTQQIGSITAAQNQDLIGTQRFLDSDPVLRAARVRGIAEGGLAQSQEQLYAEKEALFDAVRAETKKYFTDRGDSIGSVFTGMMYGITDFFGNENSALRQAGTSGRLSRDLNAAITDYLRRIEENTSQRRELSRPSGRQE